MGLCALRPFFCPSMKYVGLQTQIWRNNRRTVYLLFLFPLILLGMVLAIVMTLDFIGLFCYPKMPYEPMCREYVRMGEMFRWPIVWKVFIDVLPYVLVVAVSWLTIAYFANTAIIRKMTGARPLSRKENLRVYNMVENLCIAGNIYMPKINIVQDEYLNAFTSGIDDKSFTLTLTTGIIDKLEDDELEAVIAHELTHIKNRDTRLLVVCIVFVGIFSTLMTLSLSIIKHSFTLTSHRRGRKGGNSGVLIYIVAAALILLLCSSVAFIFSSMTRLAISRKREFVADAGGAELCGNPLALASALRKISQMPGLDHVQRDDVAQLYIIHPDEEGDEGLSAKIKKVNILFCTHPDTPDRIKLLEQF